MEMIEIQHPHHFQREAIQKSVLALGYFDGVHLGHQQVIKTAKQLAEEKKIASAVMTFTPHPSVVLGRNIQHIDMITPLEEKKRLIEQMGIDLLYVVHFNKSFASLLPQEFVDQYIIGLNVQHVVAGFDYTYGKLGKGTMETLPFHARSAFTQTIVDKLTNDKEKISSTLTRENLASGNMQRVTDLLGRHYEVSGTVVHGEKRGRQIGFPTANISLDGDYLLPRTGVYAVELKVRDTWHEAVCNVGYKPTFHDDLKKPTVEVHLLAFNEQIYGQKVRIKWHKLIRSEKKFSSVEDLVKQISLDKEETQRYFSHFSKIVE
ncbi:bifunctional riboflavin kinase/FAD synthetase [Priestia megaterium]|nr:bifunctional riboflavin kinase/FAD synthetase [Priestia megaterium]